MKTEDLTARDLESVKRICDASQKLGLNWPLAVSSFPAQTEEEKRWKDKMVLAIRIVSGKSAKTMSALQPPSESETLP